MKKNTKDEVVFLLANFKNLTARQVFNELKKELTVTYQGVHKTLVQLTNEEVLIKDKNNYSLNQDWIKKQKDFFDKANKKYSNKPDFKVLSMKENDAVTLDFSNSTLIEMAYWTLGEIVSIVPKKSREHSICHLRYVWPGTIVSDEEFPLVKKMETNANYINFCENDTQLDKLFGKFYQDIGGSDMYYNVPLEDGAELFVVHDYVFKVIWDKRGIHEWERIYEGIKDPEKAMGELYDFGVNKKFNIHIIVLRNKTISSNIRKKYLELTKKLKGK